MIASARSSSRLLQEIWNRPEYVDANLPRMHVSRVLGKLGDSPAEPRWILDERADRYRVGSPRGERSRR